MLLAYDATLEGWARAMDLHDSAAPGHSLAMAEIAMSLAQALDFPRAELAHVRRGALLHDIGMMGVPESILQKPGPLSAEEMTIVRRHPTAALELLNGIGFLRAGLEIPYCHHERWDGSGYPRGLVGEQIPLAARLYAVVDVYDALCSDRPHRRAIGRQEALAAILDGAGTLFDPRVVEVFQRVIRQYWEP